MTTMRQMAPSSKALVAWSDELRDAVLARCEELGVGYAEYTRELWARDCGDLKLLDTMPKRGRPKSAPKTPPRRKKS